MIGSFASMIGYWIAIFLLVIWMVVKIARSSPLLAVLTFLFWPVAVIALVRNWGNKETDIRVPFFLALLAGGLAVFMAVRTVGKAVEENAIYFTDADIEMIRGEDPALAGQIEQARAAARLKWVEQEGEAWDDADWEHVKDEDKADRDSGPRPSLRRRSANEDTVAQAPKPRDPAVVEAERLGQLRMASHALAYSFGAIQMPDAGASLTLPRSYLFAPRSSISMMARLRNVTVDREVLGWIVHERTDMSRDDAWYLELVVRPMSDPVRRAIRDAESVPAPLQAQFNAGDADDDGPIATVWDLAKGFGQWSAASSTEPGDERANVFAVRVFPNAVVGLQMRGAEPELHELAQRATRMMAMRVERSTTH